MKSTLGALLIALVLPACLTTSEMDRALGIAHNATRAACVAEGVIERVIDSRSGGRPLTFSVGGEEVGTATVTRAAAGEPMRVRIELEDLIIRIERTEAQ